MKRKKWSEMEEQTLLSKYSELFESGVLSKLKTREKKFKPISDHVNSLHHHRDPISFPFKWTWRDVSIKIQNMRHQYLGVKQKIKISENEFNWSDGENHWVNFLKYKEVLGDIELSENTTSTTTVKDKKFADESIISDVLGYTVETGDDDDEGEYEGEIDEDEEAEEQEEEEVEEGIDGDLGESDAGEKDASNLEFTASKGRKRRLRVMKLESKVLNLRELVIRREEKRREREWSKQMKEISVQSRDETKVVEEEDDELLIEMEKMKLLCPKMEAQKRMRLEKELSDQKRRRMEMEQKWEEEEMEWKQRMLEMQIEHENQMMQIQAGSCQTQLQILGLVARIVCHFFGSETETLTTQDLAHQGSELGNASKPGPSMFQ